MDWGFRGVNVNLGVIFIMDGLLFYNIIIL